MTIRNGRFTSARTIIVGRSGSYFRILNSADFDSANANKNAINVVFGPGDNNKVTVLPTFSIDFFARDDVEVSGSDDVQGIYDALPNEDFKSGRFRTRDPLDPTDGIKIISPGNGNASAVYRIFNTGPNAIQLFTADQDGTNPVNLGASIAEGESFDFVTPGQGKKVVFVKTAGTASDHIEGIYNFITNA